MNEDVIVDLKQFIIEAITQQTSDIRMDIGNIRQDITGIKQNVRQLSDRVGSLESKVDDGFSAIAKILEDMHADNDIIKLEMKDHGRRLTLLEQNAS